MDESLRKPLEKLDLLAELTRTCLRPEETPAQKTPVQDTPSAHPLFAPRPGTQLPTPAPLSKGAPSKGASAQDPKLVSRLLQERMHQMLQARLRRYNSPRVVKPENHSPRFEADQIPEVQVEFKGSRSVFREMPPSEPET